MDRNVYVRQDIIKSMVHAGYVIQTHHIMALTVFVITVSMVQGTNVKNVIKHVVHAQVLNLINVYLVLILVMI